MLIFYSAEDNLGEWFLNLFHFSHQHGVFSSTDCLAVNQYLLLFCTNTPRPWHCSCSGVLRSNTKDAANICADLQHEGGTIVAGASGHRLNELLSSKRN